MHGQNHIKKGNACLRHHDLLNYQTDLYKTDVFRKLMIWFSWMLLYFLLIHSQKIVCIKIQRQKLTVLPQTKAKEN